MQVVDNSDKGARFLLMIACVVVIVAGLKSAANLLVPFLSAFFIAMISLPLLNWLKKLKIPNLLAVLLTLIAVILILVVIGTIVGGSVKNFTAQIPTYSAALNQMWAGIVAKLKARGLEVPEKLLGDLIKPAAAFDAAATVLRGLANLMSNLFLVILTIIFILLEAAGFPLKLQVALGNPSGSERYESMRGEIQKYLGIKTLISLATGILIAISMALIGVEFPLLWGLLAFLLNYIPNLGSIIAAIPPVLLAIVQLGLGHAVLTAVAFLTVNMVLGNFLEPYLMGRRLGLSTLVVFLSLVFWGWIWGPIGMLLSVPMTMILKILLENMPDLRWIAILLGPTPREVPPEPEESPKD